MKPGDLVKFGGAYRHALMDIPSHHVEHDPGTTGDIIVDELCLVLEAIEKIGGQRWLKVFSSRSGATGWLEEDMMDEVCREAR